MPRTRNIKPTFFRNEDLAECSVEARLLYIGLWTLADCCGRLEDRPRRIKMDLFPADALEVKPLLDELEGKGFIRRYEVDGRKLLWVPKFVANQCISWKEAKRGSDLPPHPDDTLGRFPPRRRQADDGEEEVTPEAGSGPEPEPSVDVPGPAPEPNRDGAGTVPEPLDTGHRTQDAGHRTQDTERQDTERQGPPPPVPAQEPLALSPPEPASDRLTPAGLVALWNRETGGRLGPPEDDRLAAIKRCLAKAPLEADWGPAIRKAAALRAALGTGPGREGNWITLDWLVRKPGHRERMASGEFDWKLPGDGPRGRRGDPLRVIWDSGGKDPPPEPPPEADPPPPDQGTLWGRVVARLRERTPDYAYLNWFSQAHQVTAEGDRLVLGVPNLFVRDWMLSHYGDVLRRAATEAAGREVEIVFVQDEGGEGEAPAAMEALA